MGNSNTKQQLTQNLQRLVEAQTQRLVEAQKQLLAKTEQREQEYRDKYEKKLKNDAESATQARDKLKTELDTTRAKHSEDTKTFHENFLREIKEMKKESDDKMIKLMQEQHNMNAQMLQHISLGFSNTRPVSKGPRYLMSRSNVESRPFCLLINNSTGDEGDSKMERLKSALKQTGFEARSKNNIQENDLKATLLQVAAESDKYACIVIVMSSPADVENGHIILTHPTGGKISLRDIWTPFVKKSEQERKPKLLFLEIESDISKSRPTDLQYPSSMDPREHDFMIAHSLGDGSGSKPFLEMIYELLGRETSKDILSALDDERQKECNPRITLKCTFQDKVFLKE